MEDSKFWGQTIYSSVERDQTIIFDHDSSQDIHFLASCVGLKMILKARNSRMKLMGIFEYKEDRSR